MIHQRVVSRSTLKSEPAKRHRIRLATGAAPLKPYPGRRSPAPG